MKQNKMKQLDNGYRALYIIEHPLSNYFILSTYFCREELLTFKVCYNVAHKEWSECSTKIYSTFN